MPDATSTTSPPLNHVFVDFENVHEIDLAAIGGQGVRFTLLMGARQTRLEVNLVEKLLTHADSVQLVRLASSGRDALDFTLAYYLGRAAAADPAGRFHIVSKDTGFDPLIEHLLAKHIHVERHADFARLVPGVSARPAPPVAPPAPTKPRAAAKPQARAPVHGDPIRRVLDHLRTHPNNRPKRKTTLVRHLATHLGAKDNEANVEAIIESLIKATHLTIDEKGAVTYHL